MATETFVGRERELEDLRAALAAAQSGEGSLFLVAGEPGIGKTRLASELAREAAVLGASVHWGRCLETEGAPPYWPWLQVLRDAGAAQLLQAMPALGPVPEPEQARFRLFDSMASFLLLRSAEHLTLVILDDLHWADRPSLLFLQFLAAGLGRSRMLVLGTYRDVEVGRTSPLAGLLPELVRVSSGGGLLLRGLQLHETRRFLEERLGASPADSLARKIHAQTEGNPFFLTEVTRLLGTAERLEVVPHGVREVLVRRLDQLSSECNRILAVGSVLGREFQVGLLEAVSGVAREQLLGLLEEALHAQLVSAVPRAVGRFAFSHGLVRETLYEELSTTQRVACHRRAGEAIEALHPDHLDELAHHFTEAAAGGDSGKALDYARRAAEQATAQLAYEQAARLYELALEALEVGPDDEEARIELLVALASARYRSGEIERSLEACLEAAAAARRLQRPDLFARSALVIQGIGDLSVTPAVTRLCRQALEVLPDEEEALKARLLGQLAVSANQDGQEGVGADVSLQALELAEHSGDPEAIFAALHARQMSRTGPGGVHERMALARRALQLAESTGQRSLAGWGLAWRVDAFWQLGDISGVLEDVEALERLGEELREPLVRWRSATLRAALAIMEGRYQDAAALAQSAREIGTLAGMGSVAEFMFVVFMAAYAQECGGFEELVPGIKEHADSGGTRHWMPRAPLAVLLCGMGRRDEARLELDRLTAGGLGTLPVTALWLPGMSMVAEVVFDLGVKEPAVELYELLLPFAGHLIVSGAGQLGCRGSVHWSLGLAAAALGRWELADDHFERALEVNRRVGARPYVAHVQCDQAAALLRRARPGDRARAHRLLAQCAETTARLGMPPLQARVAALLREDGGNRPLSRRETEVAALVARGMTNRQMAESLFLSERTIETHVQNALGKLDFNTRAQLAVWAVARGLSTPRKS